MNKKTPSSSNKRFGAMVLAATVFAGVIGYETIEFQHHRIKTHSPFTKFIVPSLEDQSEKMLIALNESKQEVNSLKRLLFQQNFAKENSKISELQATLKSKEELLSKLQADTTHQKSRIETLESALAAVKDLVEVQSHLREQFQKNLAENILKTRHETIDEAKVLIDILESQLSHSQEKIDLLAEELLNERELGILKQHFHENEFNVLDAQIQNLSQDHVRLQEELMMTKLTYAIADHATQNNLAYLNLINQNLASDLEVAFATSEQAQQSKFSLTDDLSRTIESKALAENLLYKTQADLDETQFQMENLAKTTSDILDEMQFFQLLYSYGSSQASAKQVEVDRLENELVKLVDTIQQTDLERVHLSQSLNDLLSELAYQIDAHHSIVDALSDDIVLTRNEKVTLEQEILALKKDQAERELLKEELEEELALSFEKQKLLETQIVALEAAFENKTKNLHSTLDSYNKEKDELETAFQKIKMDLYAQEVINTYLAPLEIELLEKEVIFRKNTEEKEIALVEAEEQIKNLQNRLLLEQHRSEQLQKELQTASNYPAYNEEQINQLYGELERSRLLAADFQSQLKAKEEAWETQLDSYEKAQGILSRNIESLKKDLVLAEDKHLQSCKTVDQLTLDLEESLQTLKALEDQISEREKAYAKTIQELEDLNQDLLDELEKSKQSQYDEEERAALINDSLLDANEALQKTEELLKSLEEKLRLIDESMQSTATEHQSTLDELDRLQKVLSNRVHEVLDLESQLQEANERYYQSLTTLDALTAFLQAHELELEEISSSGD